MESVRLITVVEAPAFARRAEKILSAEQRKAVIDYLAENPGEGDEIPGTGGVRKIRFAAKGKGERADLSPDEKKAAAAFAAHAKTLAKRIG